MLSKLKGDKPESRKDIQNTEKLKSILTSPIAQKVWKEGKNTLS